MKAADAVTVPVLAKAQDRRRWPFRVAASLRAVLPIVAAFASLMPVPPATAAPDSASAPRPRIGLVLGGGGAKGAAHIGVLKVLEELRIPIDCVAGTSMGALVGAAFAAGVPPAELEQVVTGIDWTSTFGAAALRDQTPIKRKLAGATHSNNLEFGIQKGKIVIPGGLLRTQAVEELLRMLVQRARLEQDFDRLPLPFRAVATDMKSGEMVVLGSGDLSVAMRASMAVPGVFAPVYAEERILADGGMVRNLPVDIAREMCADVVIAVALKSPEPEADDLITALQLIGRSIDVMIKGNENAQLRSLLATDVAILVPMGDIASGDFDRVGEAIPLGARAAKAQAAGLSRYSLSADEYLAWRTAVNSEGQDRLTLAEVQITGLERVNPDFVRAHLRSAAGVEITQQDIASDTSRIYALGDFAKVEYRLTGDPRRPTLELQAVEKPWGPDYLRFDLGLNASAGGDVAFVLRADHLRTWVNSRGGQWQNTIQLGRTTILETSLYQPLDLRERFFVEPAIRASRSLEDVFDDGDRVARYDLRDAYAEVDGGLALGTRAELRAGLRYGVASASVDTGAIELPEIETTTEAGITAGFIYDTRDSATVATRGQIVRLSYLRSDESLGADESYELLEGGLVKAIPLRGDVLYVGIAGGTDLGSSLPPYRLFRLGGQRSFPGFQAGELRGSEYWTGTAIYSWKLADLQSMFGQALYTAVRVQAGNVYDRLDGIDENTIFGASINLGGRTPLGPAVVTLGGTTSGAWSLGFFLGRPIEEGSIFDLIQ